MEEMKSKIISKIDFDYTKVVLRKNIFNYLLQYIDQHNCRIFVNIPVIT